MIVYIYYLYIIKYDSIHYISRLQVFLDNNYMTYFNKLNATHNSNKFKHRLT